MSDRRDDGSDEFTLKDATTNPWTVIDKAKPGEISDELLEQARRAAEYCVDQVRTEIGSGHADAERLVHLAERLARAATRLIEFDGHHQAIGLAPEPGRPEVKQTSIVDHAAFDALRRAQDRLSEPALQERTRALPDRYAELTRKEFTLDDLAQGHWAVVNKEIPREPSDELLLAAQKTVAQCVEESFAALMNSPFGELGGIDQDYQGALARQEQLEDIAHARQLAREPVTLEAIERNPWNAVLQGLPEDAAPELYEAVARTARELLHAPDEALASLPFAAPMTDEEVADIGNQTKSRMREAEGKLFEMEERQSAAIQAETVAERAHRQSEFQSGWFIGRNLSKRLVGVANLVLGVIVGFFVSEPKLTAQQIHERLQSAGNVENLHARELVAAAHASDAAHEWQSLMTISGQQEHDLNAALTLGINATAEATLSEGHEPVRERQRSRHL